MEGTRFRGPANRVYRELLCLDGGVGVGVSHHGARVPRQVASGDRIYAHLLEPRDERVAQVMEGEVVEPGGGGRLSPFLLPTSPRLKGGRSLRVKVTATPQITKSSLSYRTVTMNHFQG